MYGEGPPSIKAKMRVAEAHDYAASKLDPIIGEGVSFVLLVINLADPLVPTLSLYETPLVPQSEILWYQSLLTLCLHSAVSVSGRVPYAGATGRPGRIILQVE